MAVGWAGTNRSTNSRAATVTEATAMKVARQPRWWPMKVPIGAEDDAQVHPQNHLRDRRGMLARGRHRDGSSDRHGEECGHDQTCDKPRYQQDDEIARCHRRTQVTKHGHDDEANDKRLAGQLRGQHGDHRTSDNHAYRVGGHQQACRRGHATNRSVNLLSLWCISRPLDQRPPLVVLLLTASGSDSASCNRHSNRLLSASYLRRSCAPRT